LNFSTVFIDLFGFKHPRRSNLKGEGILLAERLELNGKPSPRGDLAIPPAKGNDQRKSLSLR